MEEARDVVDDALENVLGRRGSDWAKIKNAIRDELGDFLWKRTKRNPMILPILMEAEA
jgi:ribonuclease J